MIPRAVAEMAARKRNDPASALAALLLCSGRPSRAEVMCRQRHRLARVYEADGRQVLAVPERRFLVAQFYTDVDPGDTDELVFVPWSYDLDDAGSGKVYLRCRCATWWTTPAKVREQIEHLPSGRRWVLVSRTLKAPRPD